MSDSLAQYSLAELETLLASWGFPRLHAKTILRRYYDCSGRPGFRGASIPLGLLRRLGDIPLLQSEVAAQRQSSDETRKLLVSYRDGARVESVLMPDVRPDRAAGCLSTQVGCAMGCGFCATGMQGFSRNLSAGEIIEQFLHLKSAAAQMCRRLRTVVFMGMGEPMLNLASVIKAIRLLAEDATGHLGWRQITVSTVGVIAPMRQFVSQRLNVQLAISLHAPTDELRSRLIPIAGQHPIAEILKLAADHQRNTGRVSIIQYCLLEGVNDSDRDAGQLGELLAGRRMHVNVLTYNLTGQPYRPTSTARAEEFVAKLRSSHRLVAHLRRSRGPDIAAACGQLGSQKSMDE